MWRWWPFRQNTVNGGGLSSLNCSPTEKLKKQDERTEGHSKAVGDLWLEKLQWQQKERENYPQLHERTVLHSDKKPIRMPPSKLTHANQVAQD